MIYLYLTLWLLSGLIFFQLLENAFNIYWLKTHKEHHPDSKDYSPYFNFFCGLLFAIGGPFVIIFFLIDSEKRNHRFFNIKQSRYMIFYNHEKAEKIVNELQENKND